MDLSGLTALRGCKVNKTLVLRVTLYIHCVCREHALIMKNCIKHNVAFKLNAVDLVIQEGNRDSARKRGVNQSINGETVV